MKRFILFILMLFNSAQILAQWYDPITKAPRPNNESRQTAGGFGAMLALTDDSDFFLKEWYNTKSSHIPRLRTTGKIKLGQSISALIFFSGCTLEGNLCNAKVNFKVIKPDTTIYAESKGNKIFSHPAPHKSIVMLSEAHLRINIEPSDPTGIFFIIAEIFNPDTGNSLVLKNKFEVIE